MEYEEVTTFFSWQSDVQGQDSFIRTALGSATSKLENERLKIINEEATRNNAGSPDIVNTIINKIQSSDVFIADITIINAETGDNNRRMPNPNVMFELGFAVALLGWQRIILLNNSRVAVEENLPFDIRNHRVTSFSAQAYNESEKGNLRSTLESAINTILTANPERAIEKVIQTEGEIKKKRDIKELKWLLEQIDFDHILGSMEMLPFQLSDRTAFYFEFSKKYFDSYFDLYDKETKLEIQELFNIFHTVVPSPLYYNPVSTGLYYTLRKEELAEDFLKETPTNLLKLKNKILKIRNIIRKNYIEIDINETNKKARNEYTRIHQID